MNSELYKLLMQYGKLDEAFIYQAFGIMIESERDLIPFINSFNVVGDESKELGTYGIENRVINIFINTIMNDNKVCKNKKLHALEVLRHEIEHAKSMKKLYECRDDIETTVIRYSLKDYAIQHGLASRDFYDDRDGYGLSFFRGRAKENYDYDPIERIARIRAWKYMVNLIKNQRTTDDLLEARINLYRAYIRGYEDNGWYLNPPTYEFLLKMGMYHDFYLFKKRVEQEEYVFDTRLLYGLPLIKGEEYDKKILNKARIIRRRQN